MIPKSKVVKKKQKRAVVSMTGFTENHFLSMLAIIYGPYKTSAIQKRLVFDLISKLNLSGYRNSPITQNAVLLLQYAIKEYTRESFPALDLESFALRLETDNGQEKMARYLRIGFETGTFKTKSLRPFKVFTERTEVDSFIDFLVGKHEQIELLLKRTEFYDKLEVLTDVGASREDSANLIELMTETSKTAKKFSMSIDSGSTIQSFNTAETHTLRTAVKTMTLGIRKKNRYIKTRIGGLNDMMGGGFESCRVYVFFGIPGGGKSTLLLNIALDAINPAINQYTLKDPTKKPVVLFISQENNQDETLVRIFDHNTNNGSKTLDQYSDKEISNSMVQQFSGPIALEFIYMDSNTIDPLDIIDIIDNIESRGYEVVMLIHDYLKRLDTGRTENRNLALGTIVNELKTIANKYRMPVVTGNQITRQGQDAFISALKSGNFSAIEKLNNSHVSESVAVLENSDGAFFLGKIPVYRDPKRFTGLMSIFLSMAVLKLRNKVGCKHTTWNQLFDVYQTDNPVDDPPINEMRIAYDTTARAGCIDIEQYLSAVTPIVMQDSITQTD